MLENHKKEHQYFIFRKFVVVNIDQSYINYHCTQYNQKKNSGSNIQKTSIFKKYWIFKIKKKYFNGNWIQTTIRIGKKEQGGWILKTNYRNIFVQNLKHALNWVPLLLKYQRINYIMFSIGTCEIYIIITMLFFNIFNVLLLFNLYT